MISISSVRPMVRAVYFTLLAQTDGRPLPHEESKPIPKGNVSSQVFKLQSTGSHPETVGDMSRVILNFDLSKIPFVHF